MNKPCLVVLSLAASVLCAFAEVPPDQVTPPEVSPKQITPHRPKIAVEQKSQRQPGGDKPLNPDQPNLTIKGIIVVTNKAEIQEGGVPAISEVVVKAADLDRPDFKDMIARRFLGKPVTDNTIRDLQDAMILYWRNRGKILLDAILPEQSIENGVLQVWLLEGKIGKVTVQNDGKKWFKDQYFMDNVRLRPLGELDEKKFNDDLNWINNNPFRQVDVTFKAGERLGLTDVQLNVQDRFPLRTYAGFEDSGTRATGPDRILFGLNWGNAFWLDHQFNYQYATDTDFDLVQAHSFSYLAPLPWRHNLLIYGSYVDAKAKPGGGTTADGHSWQASLRYSVPLPPIGKFRNQVSAGFDFKRSNNTLLTSATPFVASDTDVAQFVLEYTGLLPDKWGRTSFGLEAYYSPGQLTDRNNSQDFNNLRSRSTSYYFYTRLNGERITRLPLDFSWVVRGLAQYAPSERLLPSEELALGGYSTLRGYDERIILGDSGWVVSNELRTPPLHFTDYLHLKIPRDELQFLGFFDYGAVRVNHVGHEDEIGTVRSSPNKELYSAGVGLRYAVGSNLSFRFDYGYPLTQKELNERQSGRVHIGALVSF